MSRDSHSFSPGYESRLTSGEGRTSRFAVKRLSATELLRTITAPSGTASTRHITTTESEITETATAADGTVRTSRKHLHADNP